MERNSQKVRRPLPKKRALQAMWAAESCRTMMRLKMEVPASTFVWAFVTLAFWQCVCSDQNPSSPSSVTLKDGKCIFHMSYQECGWGHVCIVAARIRGDRDTKWFRAELQCRPVEFVSVQHPPTLSRFGFLCVVTEAICWTSQGGKWLANGFWTWQCPSHQSLLGELSLLRIDQLLRCNCLTILMLFPLCIRHSICMHLESQVFEHVFESRPVLERRGPSLNGSCPVTLLQMEWQCKNLPDFYCIAWHCEDICRDSQCAFGTCWDSSWTKLW